MRVVCVQTKERKYRKALEKKVDLTGLSLSSKDFANRVYRIFALYRIDGTCKTV